jgi:glucosamine--fructose-6-phosphate aminotransferase (isomerizing)
MLGIVNVPNSQISRLTHAGIYCHVGKEVSVASTKAFLGQVVCGFMFALALGQQRNLSLLQRNNLITELLSLPEKVQQILALEEEIKNLALKYQEATNFLFIGRRYGSIVALEGALKLKEITWNRESGIGINALGIPSGEMKHGPLAMISPSFPTFAIATQGALLKPVMNNISEILARGGKVIVLTDVPEEFKALSLSVDIISIPKTIEFFLPITATIPAQFFAYYSSLCRGCNPDTPSNLAKAVTVE